MVTRIPLDGHDIARVVNLRLPSDLEPAKWSGNETSYSIELLVKIKSSGNGSTLHAIPGDYSRG